MEHSALLKDISMVCANFGNGESFRDVLNDWFTFLGGRPGEVVVVDGGSKEPTRSLYWELFNEGLISKLQIIRPEHPENHKDLCFIQEHTAGAIAAGKYLLWFKSDTLPFRRGHDNWLAEAIEYLERPDVFAVGGSFNRMVKHHDAWPGWYFTHKCSENFSLMKRSSFMAAMEFFAGSYIASGFREPSPAAATGQERFLIEVAFERYMAAHEKYTLVREESPDWTVFHTNAAGERLVKVRQDYLERKNIRTFMNAGCTNKWFARLYGGCYYGKPRRRLKELRVAFGESPLSVYWRRAKQLFGVRRATG